MRLMVISRRVTKSELEMYRLRNEMLQKAI